MSIQRTYQPIKAVRRRLQGMRFGLLTVNGLLGSYKNSHYWECLCDCGSVVEVSGRCLLSGNTRSCGCLGISKISKLNRKHGLSGTPQYGMWRRMIQRCTDKNCTDYKYYGGRGITVHQTWLDYDTFLKDVGERPEGLTLDRIDNNKGYEPGNVRWVDRKTQSNNTSSNAKFEYNGKLHSIQELADLAGIEYGTMKARLQRLKYTVEQAISKPVKCGLTLGVAKCN